MLRLSGARKYSHVAPEQPCELKRCISGRQGRLFISVLCRFLTARGSVCKATQQLRKTLQWRSENKIHELHWDEVKDCAQGGRLELLTDTDKQTRPIIFYRLR